MIRLNNKDIARALLWTALCLFGDAINAAQSVKDATAALAGGLEVQVVLGFSNTYRLGAWTPLSVIVTNHRKRFNGKIEVQISRGNELEGSVFTTTYQRTLTLSQNARKQFRFTILLDNFAKPLVIRITRSGQEVSRRILDLRQQFTERQLIVVLSRDADLDYLNHSATDQLRVVYPHPELLPARWQGYDGVSAMVVHGQSLERLSARQYTALKRWLIQGGKLIASGSPDYSLLRTPRLAALLPAEPIGLLSISDGHGFGEALGRPLSVNRSFVINRVTNLNGPTIFQIDGIPLVLRRDYGMGKVFYFTFDIAAYPFDRWSGMAHLWIKTFNRSPTGRPSSTLHNDLESPIPNMLDGPNRGFPDHLVVFAFLVIYLGTLKLGYQSRLAKSRKRRLAYALVWLGPILFAPLAYYVFGPLLYPLGTSALTVATVEPLPKGGYARADLTVGFYSNLRRPVQWQFENLSPVLTPVLRVHKDLFMAPNWHIHEGRSTSVIMPDSTPYVLHRITGKDIIQYDLHAQIRYTDAGIFLNVRNQTGQDLQVAGLIFDNNVYAIPTIEINSNEQDSIRLTHRLFSLDRTNWPAALNSVNTLTRHLQHTAAFAIETQTKNLIDQHVLEPDEAWLIAVSPTPIIKSRFESLVAHHELTLVVVRVPVHRPQRNLSMGRHAP